MLTSREQEAFASDTAIMTIDEVLAGTKLGKTTVYELMAADTFPKSLKPVGKKWSGCASKLNTGIAGVLKSVRAKTAGNRRLNNAIWLVCVLFDNFTTGFLCGVFSPLIPSVAPYE
ncbi:AlpA family phage regulatory protein [Labrenzia sp. DG1229]|uniref:helix-turn-helix transcriptional regulator n=1 Tax=Labrenzia sp. DG1229 TaxID=681847 RepID=UPI0004920CB8|nr:AlpA family phage regulatory protein [Labrenzia sp. DG1229]